MNKEKIFELFRYYTSELYNVIEKDKDLDLREKLEIQEVVKNFSLLANNYDECVRNMHLEELKQIKGEER